MIVDTVFHRSFPQGLQDKWTACLWAAQPEVQITASLQARKDVHAPCFVLGGSSPNALPGPWAI